MILKIREEHYIIKPCEITDLPNFVVITGKNGAGKTQLLKYIADNHNDVDLLDDETPLYSRRFINHGFQFEEEQSYEQIFKRHHATWERLKLIVPLHGLFLDSEPIDMETESEVNQALMDYYSQGSQTTGSSTASFGSISIVDMQIVVDLIKNTGKKHLEFIDYFAFVHFHNELLSSNLPLIFYQFALKQKYYPHTVKDVEPPWSLFEKLLINTGSDYLLNVSTEEYLEGPVRLTLKHKDKPTIVNLESLSSGEKTILSLVTVLYNTAKLTGVEHVLLMDEPDAFLHPSLTDKFLKAIEEELVQKRSIKVVMTTHSPSTVALSPPDSIYVMDWDPGYPKPADKDAAIRLLTKGLTTFSVSLDNRKEIFTEAENDRRFYQLIFEKLMDDGKLEKDQLLHFIPVTGKSNDRGGGVDKVIELTEMFVESGNRNIYGVIDWDCVKRKRIDKVIVFGDESRYNIENFIYDPIFIGAYMLQHNTSKLIDFGFTKKDDHTSFLKFNAKRLQALIDIIAPQVFDSMDWTEETRGEEVKSGEPVEVNLIKGEKVTVPKWYTVANGHAIANACRKAFISIEKRETGWWIEKIVKPNYMFLPVEVKKTFEHLQSLRMRTEED